MKLFDDMIGFPGDHGIKVDLQHVIGNFGIGRTGIISVGIVRILVSVRTRLHIDRRYIHRIQRHFLVSRLVFGAQSHILQRSGYHPQFGYLRAERTGIEIEIIRCMITGTGDKQGKDGYAVTENHDDAQYQLRLGRSALKKIKILFNINADITNEFFNVISRGQPLHSGRFTSDPILNNDEKIYQKRDT